MLEWFKQKKTEVKSFIADYARFGDVTTNPKQAIPPQIMYAKTAIAYTCVEKIAKQALSFNYLVKDQNDKIIPSHPIHKLLFERSIIDGGQCVFSSIIRNLLVHGEAYALRMPYDTGGNITSKIARFKSILPTHVGKTERNENVITSYQVQYSGKSITLPVDQITGYSDLLRISMYNSLTYNTGVSPMEAVGIEGRLIERVLNWNLSTLDKGLKPSAVISSETNNLTQKQYEVVKDNLKKMYQGSENASEVIILPNGLKMDTIQMNSKDMDFSNTIDKVMKNVALAFNVPMPLLFADASTLDNYKMAIEEFIDQTVIPQVNDILGAFNKWFELTIGDGARIVIDESSIKGLEFKTERKGKRLTEFVKAGIITPNEARKQMGYEPYSQDAADLLYLTSSMTPIDLLDGEPPEAALSK